MRIAAYRLDQILDLGMVPPTVARRVGVTSGSLQYWVEGFEVYGSGEKRLRRAVADRTWARITIFDYLMNNPDRNAGNILVREDGRVALIDHSRAALFRGGVQVLHSWIPVRYDRDFMSQLAALDVDRLHNQMSDFASVKSVKQILRRRDRLAKRFEKDLEEKGRKVVY